MDETTTLTRMILSRLFRLFSPRGRHTEPPPPGARAGSVFVRHLDCGSCNGCELEILALNNPLYDLERFGIRFVASPRHADLLLLTGPFTRNMKKAALATFQAMPSPQRIVTIGDCAAFSDNRSHQGGYRGSYALVDLAPEMQPCLVAHASGCPPTPQQLLETLLSLTA